MFRSEFDIEFQEILVELVFLKFFFITMKGLSFIFYFNVIFLYKIFHLDNLKRLSLDRSSLYFHNNDHNTPFNQFLEYYQNQFHLNLLLISNENFVRNQDFRSYFYIFLLIHLQLLVFYFLIWIKLQKFY